MAFFCCSLTCCSYLISSFNSYLFELAYLEFHDHSCELCGVFASFLLMYFQNLRDFWSVTVIHVLKCIKMIKFSKMSFRKKH